MREDVPALTANPADSRALTADSRALTAAVAGGPGLTSLAASRRRLAADGVGILVSIVAFGLIYGLTARLGGFSVIEAVAMSSIVFAGSAQFAALGALAAGAAWPAVVAVTALLNARHLLYSAVLTPWLRDEPAPRRAVMAHVLTDEAFALSIAHFRRVGRADIAGYWAAALGTTFVPWNLATLAGYAAGAEIPDPARLGLDIVFPAAMAGLAAGMLAGRTEVVAAIGGAAVAIAVGLAVGPPAGILAGGVLGPLAGLAVGRRVPPPGVAVSAAERSVTPDRVDR